MIDLNILFDQPTGAYMPGQLLTGKVRVFLNSQKVIKKIKIKFEGGAEVKWTEDERASDSEKKVTYRSREQYFKKKLILEQKEEYLKLQPGEYLYPFQVLLPKNIPSSFADVFGNIYYHAIAKLEIVAQMNKMKKEFFKVKNFLNLNDFHNLKVATEIQNTKKFSYLCCIPGGKLTINACIPRSGFVPNENIPLILEINNQSSVRVRKVTAILLRKIEWRANFKTRHTFKKLKAFSLGSTNPHSSLTLSENIPVPEEDFPYLENCHIIILKHVLQIALGVEGAHCDFDVFLPITIGDVPFVQDDANHHSDHFLLPPDYEESSPESLDPGFVCYGNAKSSEKDQEIILKISSLATESKSMEIFDTFSSKEMRS